MSLSFTPNAMLTNSSRLVCVLPAARNSAGNIHQLFSLPPQTSSVSWWILLMCLSLSRRIQNFFFPYRPAVPWGIQQCCEVSLLSSEPSTFVSGCVWWHLFAVEIWAIFAAPQYLTKSYHLLFPSYTDALIMARLWLAQYFSPQTKCRFENEIQHEILQAEPWTPAHYQLSILGSITLCPLHLCLDSLQLSLPIFFLWWQHIRHDKHWSGKSQSSIYLLQAYQGTFLWWDRIKELKGIFFLELTFPKCFRCVRHRSEFPGFCHRIFTTIHTSNAHFKNELAEAQRGKVIR